MKKLTACLLLLLSVSAVATIEVVEFNSPQQEQDYRALIQELRCPQCQNNNIADSNATIATDMRAKVLELLKEGRTKQDVTNYMIERYGNFVTYDPPVTAGTIILWIAPILMLLFGFGFLWRRKSQPKAQQAVSSAEILTDEQKQRLNALLKDKE
ncbi:cytochrome c-type biogenesis protein CcmH [Haemophilus paracuniculus]|uniref:Cytochrome c-type biogenesis protein n=1 Tax=Haemophilus paracuniculus TaxID=734 RepID=A0A1T0AU47_9PAST|nr:cytochrome c-type biogenesis protein [Haemophilus paracuniculus]OOS00219.1 cytochrome c-type biogenesis protein CcmH [Haemophilus paracuniculus]